MLMMMMFALSLQGASIIRMLKSVLGSETFLAGLRLYLQRHQYSSAETSDLWSAMTEEVSSTSHVMHPVRAPGL